MKRISKISLLFSIFFILCGFKNTTIIDIKKDNSVVIEVDLLVKNSKIYDEEYSYLTSSVKAYEKNDFKVSAYKEKDYRGFKITKEVEDIKTVSKNRNDEISISNILDDNFYMNGLFSLKSNLFKNTYSAKYKYEFNKSKYLGNTNIINEIELDDLDNNIYENTTENELSLIVNLPHKVLNSDATKVSNNGKTLTWIFVPDEVNNIHYSFEVLNKSNIIILCVCVFLLVVILFLVLIFIRKKKASKETLICTSFDPSIEGSIKETIVHREK